MARCSSPATYASVGRAGLVGVLGDEVHDLHAVEALVAQHDAVHIHATRPQDITHSHAAPLGVADGAVAPVGRDVQRAAVGHEVLLAVARALERRHDLVLWELLLQLLEGEGAALDAGGGVAVDLQLPLVTVDVRHRVVVANKEEVVPVTTGTREHTPLGQRSKRHVHSLPRRRRTV